MVCDDGLYCNGVESCDSGLGCQAGTAVDCDDSNAWTNDSCDETGDTCLHAAVVIDEGDACTTDACDPLTGISHTPLVCDDGLYCNGVESCDSGLGCQAGTAVDCDDSNACTTDSCDETGDTCLHAAVVIDDGDACTTDACDPVTGISYTPVVCDDGLYILNGVESCDSGLGCQAGTAGPSAMSSC